MRTKDQVRRDVWKAMEREGVSRFPGAEGRIPNFAGAKLAAEKLAGHRRGVPHKLWWRPGRFWAGKVFAGRKTTGRDISGRQRR